MICPKCNNTKVKVVDVATLCHDPVVYRRRKCPKCAYTFYTQETTVSFTKEIADIWYAYR